MAYYAYKQLTESGECIEGTLESVSLQEARYALLERGGVVLELKEKKGSKIPPLTFKERIDFTHHMQLLLSAGLPIYESLLSLQEKKVKYNAFLKWMSSKIKQGESLSAILRELPESFSPFYVAVISASEASGDIQEGFKSLEKLQEKQARLIKVIKGALTYPSILLVFSFLIIYALLFFIIPSLRELFEGKTVGGFTGCVLFLSDFALRYQGALALIGGSLLSALGYSWHKGHLKKIGMKIFEQTPFFKTLIRSLKLENFFGCLALLLSRGINLKDALVLSKNTLAHEGLEKALDNVIAGVLKGRKLSDSFEEPFPPVAKRLMGLAEITGKLSYAAQQLSEIYEEETREKINQLTLFLQPLLLALIGFIIGAVVLSILIPLTDVGGFI